MRQTFAYRLRLPQCLILTRSHGLRRSVDMPSQNCLECGHHVPELCLDGKHSCVLSTTVVGRCFVPYQGWSVLCCLLPGQGKLYCQTSHHIYLAWAPSSLFPLHTHTHQEKKVKQILYLPCSRRTPLSLCFLAFHRQPSRHNPTDKIGRQPR